MKHNSPQGPQPTGVAIFEQFPVLWAWLSGEQILGLDLPGEWVLGLDLSLGGPLTPSSPLLLPHCCKYFNEMEKKKKRQKKKKRKKISSLEATRSLRPGQPGISPEQSCTAGPWKPGLLHVFVHPQPGWAGRQSSFLQSRDRKQNLEATSKQRTRFLPGTRFCRLLPCFASPWHQSALLGRVPHCLPQDLGPVSPSPPHWPGGGTRTPKDAFAKMAVLSL